MKNRGIDLAKEIAEQSPKDWAFGAGSKTCIALMKESERERYLPEGETQVGREDTMDCASRAPVNILETKFSYLFKNSLMSEKNRRWLIDMGYTTIDRRVEFSDRFVAINSGTTRNGNSLKAPLEAIRKQGLIPKKLLPLKSDMTWDDYHNPSRITRMHQKLGREFLERFTINYERVYENDFENVLHEDMVDVAGYAWPTPVNGEYPRSDNQFNHAFVNWKTPKTYAYDNYPEKETTFSDYTKKLASDYKFFDYGYRIFISEEKEPQVGWLKRLIPWL